MEPHLQRFFSIQYIIKAQEYYTARTFTQFFFNTEAWKPRYRPRYGTARPIEAAQPNLGPSPLRRTVA